MVRNATVDAVVGLDVNQGVATVRAYTTAPQAGAKAVLRDGQRLLMEEHFDGGPGTFFEASVPLRDDASGEELSIEILDATGHCLVSWQVPAATQTEIPQPAQAIERPAQLDSVEALYLAGLHLEQYRHATREPADYYREGLLRDPGDSRCNNAMGQLLYRRGRFAEAEPYLRRAIERLTRHNPNPCDSEPYFSLWERRWRLRTFRGGLRCVSQGRVARRGAGCGILCPGTARLPGRSLSLRRWKT